uniref:Uncharacterized protein n=1 Tax=Oryza meridionalis TaxID=40149 RepID=A0A0E0E0U9_9ORYZ
MGGRVRWASSNGPARMGGRVLKEICKIEMSRMNKVKTRSLGDLLNSSAGPKLAFGCEWKILALGP